MHEYIKANRTYKLAENQERATVMCVSLFFIGWQCCVGLHLRVMVHYTSSDGSVRISAVHSEHVKLIGIGIMDFLCVAGACFFIDRIHRR